MLEFFRRYQRAFFIVITAVIVISFSFFGTFQTFSGHEQDDKVAFTAVDGSKVRRSEVMDMVAFLSSDAHDYLFSQSGSGNALNDGVIATDILQSGIADIIAAPYLAQIGSELQPRLEREKRFKPYSHPKAPFLTAEQIWAYYAPNIKSNFDALQSTESAKDKDAFATRVQLYVAERTFPAAYLRQFLRMQEASHKWLPQDPNLAYVDLSLFSYHSTQDWFGHQFVELSAQFIINSAKVAEQKGYKITKEEVLASLFRNAEEAFREGRAHGALAASNVADFFQEQLRRLRMDQSRLVKLWTQVLLFRTLFFENADTVLVDTASYRDFYHHQNEYVDIDLYQLPQGLRFTNMQGLEEFALYLKAVRPQLVDKQADNPLSLPLAFASPQEVKKIYPELVERTYTLRIAEVNKESLETKIGVRGTWEWQVADNNWRDLQKRYPELEATQSSSVEDRLRLLDSLDPAKRALVDTYSRQQIIDQHPEWIRQALESAQSDEKEVSLREQGGKIPLQGFKNAHELMSLLDKAPLNEVSPELTAITQDGVHYAQIVCVDHSKPERILTFDEAKNDGTMAALLDKALEASYSRLRSKEPSLFSKDNGEWKPFKEIKQELAFMYFDELFGLLDREIEVYKERLPHYTDWTNREKARLAVSLLPYVQEEQVSFNESLASGSTWPEQGGDGPNQFALVKSRQRLIQRDNSYVVNPALAFGLDMESLSPITDYQMSGPCFFMVVAKGFLPDVDLVREKVLQEQDLLGAEAIISYAQALLAQMQKSGSLNIESLSSREIAPVQAVPQVDSVNE